MRVGLAITVTTVNSWDSAMIHGSSLKAGLVTEARVRELVGQIARPNSSLRDDMLSAVPQMAGYAYDTLVVDGDLHVAGSLDTFEIGVSTLIVTGDLVVDGLFMDRDDPETLTLVLGSMRAHNILTAGWLEVLGDLAVTEALIGDYNDCSAYIQGNGSAALFYPENHFFTVGGKFECPCAIGETLIDAAEPVEFLAWHDMRLLDHLDPALLVIYDDEWEDEDGVVHREFEIEDINYKAIVQRVREGTSLRTTATDSADSTP